MFSEWVTVSLNMATDEIRRSEHLRFEKCGKECRVDLVR